MGLRRIFYSMVFGSGLVLLFVFVGIGKPPLSQALQPSSTPAFGPIVDPAATPEPLHTPLPAELRTRPCETLVIASAITLHETPNPASITVGAAVARERFFVSDIVSNIDGWQWAETPEGWLPLTMDGVHMAQLLPLRGCDVLTGTAPDTTLLGLHMINGTSSAQVLRFVQQMRAAGHPLGTLKGLNGSEATLNQVELISPETVTVFRSVHLYDCPEGALVDLDPVATAQQWMADMLPYWQQVNADYYELWHECGATLSWIADFSIEAMRYANEEGICLLLFSFPGGNPEMDTFDDLVPVYRYALNHPCASGRLHGIALHAFSLSDNTLVSEEDVWVALRHRIFYDRLQVVFPAGTEVPVYITEAGIGGRTLQPTCDTVIRDALQFTYLLEQDPYVKGFHLWNVGSGEQWYDITPCLPALSSALIEYYSGSD
jgi:hypothetical protein